MIEVSFGILNVFEEYIKRINNENNMYPPQWLLKSNKIEVENGE